jgi:HlyD family secretion protein
MKRLIAIVIVLAAGTAGYYLYRRSAPPKTPSNVLKLHGNIEAHESLVGFKVAGRIVKLPVQEGQSVKPGQLLARLDDADYRQQVAIDESRLRVAQDELALQLAGTRHQEIKAAQQAVVEAQADLHQKQLDYQRAETLFREDAVSAQSRDVATTNLKRAQAALQRTQQAYDQAKEGARPEQITISRANVRQAQQTLKLARIKLGYTSLFAPDAGVVLVRQAELGEVVSPGAPVVTLADLDHVWMRAYVAETDLGRVRWGQEASVTTDTFPGKIYRGRISFIASDAEFTPKTIQTEKEKVTLVYRIKIDLDNPNHELKPGMPVDAELQLSKR